MKILMINVVCGIGSTGRICTDQAEELISQGHEVRIAYGRGEVPEKYRPVAHRIGNDADVYLHVLKARLFDAAGFGSRRVTERFIEWIRAYDPDEIRMHNLHGYYLHVGVLFDYLRTCGKPVTWTLHDCWAFTGHCAHYMATSCARWKTGCKNPCPEKKSYPGCIGSCRCERNYIRKKELFTGIGKLSLIVPSAWLAGEVRQSFLNAYSEEIRYNDIDHTVFKPTDSTFREGHGLSGEKILLGVAGKWTKRKGFNDYLKLAGMLDDSYRIVLVGVTKKQKRTLPERMIGIERTNSKQELAEIYTSADVFVNLTYEDNYPTVNLEAEACGTPVITYDTGGCRETIRRPDSAVVERGDLEQVVMYCKRISA